MKTEITMRIWRYSPLIGKRVKDINKEFNIIITKVARGLNASSSNQIKVEEADYITVVGNNKQCIKIAKSTVSNEVKKNE